MTVIATAVAKDGTAILAADGRGWEFESGAILDDGMQKIFPIKGGAAFALTGWAGTESFRLTETAIQALDAIVGPMEFREGIITFALAINRRLDEAKSAARWQRIEHPEQDSEIKRLTIARILLMAPVEGGARVAVARFHHRDGILQDPIITERVMRPGSVYFLGSKAVADMLYGEGKPLTEDASQEDAIACVTEYIEACADEDNVKLDSWCSKCGGRIHIAALSTGGFRWIRRPAIAAA